MSSIFSTQKRHTFLRRKYCFFCVSTALSPPVGRWDALPGLPLDSAISFLSLFYAVTVAALPAAQVRLMAPGYLASVPLPMAAQAPEPLSPSVGRAFHGASCASPAASASRRREPSGT